MVVEVKPMEIKKTQQAVSTPAPVRENTVSAWRLGDFIGDVKEELKKITWTTPDELRAYTKIVVAATFIMGMGIYGMDLFIQAFLNGFDYLIHLVGG